MKTYQFNGVRVYTEFITVELECESLEEAQSIIDGGKFEHGIVKRSGHEDIDLQYVGIENYMSLDDPRFLFDTEDVINDIFSKE
jgi:hypothetical protein